MSAIQLCVIFLFKNIQGAILLQNSEGKKRKIVKIADNDYNAIINTILDVNANKK